MPKALQKTTGTMVAFGDVVQLSKARSQDPDADGFERYIGLEHLEPSNLKVSRWGEIADGVTFTSVFRPGQVLFGKRRAYQRKVAVADFSGVCSGDIYVLEPKGDRLLPELLPFICQSEPFYDYVISMSQGGLSPRVNWKALAKYEFVLPPLEEQRRIAGALQAAEAAKEAVQTLMNSSLATKAAFTETFIQQNPPDTALDAVLDSTAYGTSERASEEERGLPVLRIPNVVRGAILLEDLKWIEMNDVDEERYRVDDGDVLIVRTNGNPDYVGRCVVVRSLPRTFVYASYLIRLKTSPERLVPEFLTAMLNAPTIRRTMRGAIRSSAGNYNLNTKGIRSQRIPLPGTDEQKAFLRVYSAIGDGVEQAKKREGDLRRLQSSLLEEVSG